MAEDADKLRFSSSWDIDQVLQSGTSTYTVPNGTSNQTLITHTLGYPPLALIQYKVGSYWQEPGYLDGFTGTPGLNATSSVQCHQEITSTEVKVHFNNSSGSSKSVQVRWWILERSIT